MSAAFYVLPAGKPELLYGILLDSLCTKYNMVIANMLSFIDIGLGTEGSSVLVPIRPK